MKTVVATLSGHPDITVCFRGQYIAIEVKAPDNKYWLPDRNLLQKEKIRQIRETNGIAVMLNSYEMYQELMRQVECNRLDYSYFDKTNDIHTVNKEYLPF